MPTCAPSLPKNTTELKFQAERWLDVLPELRPLFHFLWEDVAVDKDRFRARCNEAMYAQMAANGFVHVITARFEGKIVGWYVMTIMVNGHYADAGLMAFCDQYFLRSEFRKGNAGLRLFQEAIKYAKSKGAQKFYTSHKIHRDRSGLMKLLGFKATDVIYSKLL